MFDPWLGRCPRVGKGNPLQYTCLENFMDPGGLHSMGSQRVGYDWAPTHNGDNKGKNITLGQDYIINKWKTQISSCRRTKLDPLSYTTHKNEHKMGLPWWSSGCHILCGQRTQNELKVNLRPETGKLLGKAGVKSLKNKTKIKKVEQHQTEIHLHSKRKINKMKRQTTEWRKHFKLCIW